MTDVVPFRDLAVFCRDGSGGNPLAFVDAIEVDESRWLEVAKAIGYSETVFAEMDTGRVHIFTPAGRISFAGHPLVGSAFAFGPDMVTITYDMGTALPNHGAEGVNVNVELVATVRRIDPPSFAAEAWEVSVPSTYQILRTDSPAGVAELDAASLDPALDHAYVWAWQDQETVRARFFAAGFGITEDPATGSAAAALSAVLGGSGRLTVFQGEEMGSPSQIQLAWDGSAVTLGGEVDDRGYSAISLA